MSDERLNELERRVAILERESLGNRRLGPQPVDPAETERAVKSVVDAVIKNRPAGPPPPVDHDARVLVSGDPVPGDHSHTELKANGQQKDYVVLTATERSKGFARPYRDAYKHLKCGKITTMGRAIAETYARDPNFYTGTFCATCGTHLPIGEGGEFVWYEMDGSIGPKVGT